MYTDQAGSFCRHNQRSHPLHIAIYHAEDEERGCLYDQLILCTGNNSNLTGFIGEGYCLDNLGVFVQQDINLSVLCGLPYPEKWDSIYGSPGSYIPKMRAVVIGLGQHRHPTHRILLPSRIVSQQVPHHVRV